MFLVYTENVACAAQKRYRWKSTETKKTKKSKKNQNRETKKTKKIENRIGSHAPWLNTTNRLCFYRPCHRSVRFYGPTPKLVQLQPCSTMHRVCPSHHLQRLLDALSSMTCSSLLCDYARLLSCLRSLATSTWLSCMPSKTSSCSHFFHSCLL